MKHKIIIFFRAFDGDRQIEQEVIEVPSRDGVWNIANRETMCVTLYLIRMEAYDLKTGKLVVVVTYDKDWLTQPRIQMLNKRKKNNGLSS